MSVLEMKVPSPGESISEVEIAQWLVADGDYVEKDQAIAEVDSDKATLELPAEESGIITLKAEEGDAVAVGAVVCLIDTSAERPAGSTPASKTEEVKEEKAAPAPVAEKTVVPSPNPVNEKSATYASGTPSVAAAKIMAENGVNPSKVAATGKDGRITKQDVVAAMAAGFPADAA
ncbi:E3 binding domain-containing protein, partial [Crocinitomicaceae bacterium]|nr:E3 binding domain-containing protein [Crocinitomicaceae bacterium]